MLDITQPMSIYLQRKCTKKARSSGKTLFTRWSFSKQMKYNDDELSHVHVTRKPRKYFIGGYTTRGIPNNFYAIIRKVEHG